VSKVETSTRVLFVTRRFPPSVGGMQTLAADIDQALRAVAEVELVALRKSSPLHLAWFLPLAALRTAFSLARGGVSQVVCGDAIAWATVAPVVKAMGVKSSVMVMGLDLSFPNPLYQRWIRSTLPRADRIVAISTATATTAIERGLEKRKVAVVNPGVRVPNRVAEDRADARAELVRRLGLVSERLIVVTLGRLVRRKGVDWFVENVLPQVIEDATYLVAGEGPMCEEIDAAVARSGTEAGIRLLGRVDLEFRELLLRGADISVMPNVRVPGDIEGFGLVAVESACRGALVLAAALEGITDAVVDGETGILVEPEHPEAFVSTIRALAVDRDRLAALAAKYQEEALERFSVDRMAREFRAAIGLP
jgi:phosphatidylinositol alpha-1,6-mannosyltransferase